MNTRKSRGQSAVKDCNKIESIWQKTNAVSKFAFKKIVNKTLDYLPNDVLNPSFNLILRLELKNDKNYLSPTENNDN